MKKLTSEQVHELVSRVVHPAMLAGVNPAKWAIGPPTIEYLPGGSTRSVRRGYENTGDVASFSYFPGAPGEMGTRDQIRVWCEL